MVTKKRTKGALDDEEAFPRGGGDVLTPLEKRQIEYDAKAAAKDEAATTKKRRKKQTTEYGEEDEDLFFEREVLQGSMPKYAELLKFKSLSVGMKLWGMVQEVSPRGLQISLPHGLRGIVAPNQASDVLNLLSNPSSKSGELLRKALGDVQVPTLSQLFHVGQFVRVVVVALGGDEEEGSGPSNPPRGSKPKRRTIQVSLLLSSVMAGCTAHVLGQGGALPAVVRTVEDHGYTLSLGIKGVKGFLSRRDHEATFGGGATLIPGTLIEVVPRGSGKEGAEPKPVVGMSCNSAAVASAVVKEVEGLGLEELLPGTCLNVKVRNVLSDGLLVTFLTFFHGIIDKFNLGDAVLGKKDWQAAFPVGSRHRARVIYVDPATKRVGLTMLPHLMNLCLPSPTPLLGQLFEKAYVRRVDPQVGLLLQLPLSEDTLCPAYCHVSNISEDRTTKLESKFSSGQSVRARVIGFRLMDGLASVSMKKSVVEHEVMQFRDLYVGQDISGSILAVEAWGLLLSVAPAIKAVVPVLHCGDVSMPINKLKAKFKVGATVKGRVLNLVPEEQKVVVTLKKGLIGSKLPPLASWEAAGPGVRAHGVVTGLKDYGVFVSFYGRLSGLAATAELGLQAGQRPADVFTLGQVVKTTILSVDAAKQRLRLSLKPKKTPAAADAPEVAEEKPSDPLAGLQPGDVVEAKVAKVLKVTEPGRQPSYLLELKLASGKMAQGLLEAAHLADHPAAVEALVQMLVVGAVLGKVLVLERLEGQKLVRVTRKHYMVAAASTLPRDVSAVRESALLPGYVASITNDAVFIRFLNHVTGRAGLAQLSDSFVSDPRLLFSEGASVMAQVAGVDAARQRFSVTLKHSLTASNDASYLANLFRDLQLADKCSELQSEAAGEPSSSPNWSRDFPIQSLVRGSVSQMKEFGAMLDLEKHPDVVGLIRPKHYGPDTLSPGQPVSGVVLDVEPLAGIVDVSLVPELVATSSSKTEKKKGAASKLTVGAKVEAVVQLVKDEYCVLSVPDHAQALIFAATTDINIPSADRVPRKFEAGMQAVATVTALASENTGGRILAHVPLTRVAVGDSALKRKREDGEVGNSKTKAWEVGKVSMATVTSLQPLCLEVKVGRTTCGRIHISEVLDLDVQQAATGDLPKKSPLERFSVQESVRAVVLGKRVGQEGVRKLNLDMSIRPKALEAAQKGETPKPQLTLSTLKPGQSAVCWVADVAADHLWLDLAQGVRGRVSALDASTEPAVMANLAEHFSVGMAVAARVVQANPSKKQLDLSLVDPLSGSSEGAAHPSLPVNSLVGGRVVSIGGYGVRVGLGSKKVGTVSLTDIHDAWVDNALTGLKEGDYIRCRVLAVEEEEADGKLTKAVLSLRPSQGGKRVDGSSAVADGSAKKVAPASTANGKKGLSEAKAAPELLAESDLKVGSVLGGYVRRAGKPGVFVALDRQHTARITLGRLSDGYVADPVAAFPAGSFVEGRLVAVEGGKLEMSLKTSTTKSWRTLADLKEGEVVAGRVRRVEKYGLFVDIACSNVVGLAHISELLDDGKKVSDVAALYKAHQPVKAVVLSVDAEAGKVSLSLVPSKVAEARQRVETTGVEEKDFDEELLDMHDTSTSSSVEEEEGEEEEEDEGEKSLEALDESEEEAEGEEEEEAEEEEEEEEEKGTKAKKRRKDSRKLDESEDEDEAEDDDEENDEEDSSGLESESDDEGELAAHTEERKKSGATAGVAPRSIWGGLALIEDGEDPADAGREAHKSAKGSARRAAAEREAAISAAEERMRKGGAGVPASTQEFEAAVLASPSSSYVWIQYMAYHVGLGEVEKARAVAERALQTIHYREEQEKFNVWVAWLNLENLYGEAAEEAVMALFQRALTYMDHKKLYKALLDILDRTDKKELARKVLETAVRKFPESTKMWLRLLESKLTEGEGDGARKVLERALATLPRAKHVKAIMRAALAEFRVGSAERGRGIMEGLLRNHPSRLDLWSVYLDQEIKLADTQRTRALFERATHLTLPAKKMKFMFKRYLEYEKAHGTAATVNHVKQRAMEFVESLIKS